jgi:hypothetical protein
MNRFTASLLVTVLLNGCHDDTPANDSRSVLTEKLAGGRGSETDGRMPFVRRHVALKATLQSGSDTPIGKWRSSREETIQSEDGSGEFGGDGVDQGGTGEGEGQAFAADLGEAEILQPGDGGGIEER